MTASLRSSGTRRLGGLTRRLGSLGAMNGVWQRAASARGLPAWAQAVAPAQVSRRRRPMELLLEDRGATDSGEDPRQVATPNPGTASGVSLRANFFWITGHVSPPGSIDALRTLSLGCIVYTVSVPIFLDRGTRVASRKHRRSKDAFSRVYSIYSKYCAGRTEEEEEDVSCAFVLLALLLGHTCKHFFCCYLWLSDACACPAIAG
jgi:hypothetical protein